MNWVDGALLMRSSWRVSFAPGGRIRRLFERLVLECLVRGSLKDGRVGLVPIGLREELMIRTLGLVVEL